MDDGYKLHQRDYIDGLLLKYVDFLPDEKQRIPKTGYDRNPESDLLGSKELKLYQELLGSFNWLAGISRPDLAFCVSKFASFTKEARKEDLEQLKRVFLYLRNTKNFAVEIRKSNYAEGKITLHAFSDASLANEEDRKSRTGYIIYTNGTPISWKSKR